MLFQYKITNVSTYRDRVKTVQTYCTTFSHENQQEF